MSIVVIIAVVIFLLIVGKILYHTGEALMDSDYPPSFPEIVSRTLRFFGSILYGVGLTSCMLAVVLGCAYVLRELL